MNALMLVVLSQLAAPLVPAQPAEPAVTIAAGTEKGSLGGTTGLLAATHTSLIQIW